MTPWTRGELRRILEYARRDWPALETMKGEYA
jgi:hypothetical protein